MVKNLVQLVITSFLTLVISYYLFILQTEITQIDLYEKFEDNYFSKPNFVDNQVELLVNGESKDRIGVLELMLINFSLENLKDVEVRITIKPEATDGFDILAYTTLGPDGKKIWVEEIEKMKKVNGEFQFLYKLESLNRVKKAKPGFYMQILYEGNYNSDVDVILTGAEIRKYERENQPGYIIKKGFQSTLTIGATLAIIVVIVLPGTILLSPLISRFTRKSEIRSNQKYAKDLAKIIIEKGLLPTHNRNDVSNFVTTLLFENRVRRFNKNSILNKWAQGGIKPERDEYKIDDLDE